ncbi:MAG: GNAT family N-acetyltransferase [bacterium]
MTTAIRQCRPDEQAAILAVINAAAERYRRIIPADCFHEPYMSAADLAQNIESGVSFWGSDDNGELVGVMGIQPVQDVTLVRHAYVRPDQQGKGIGGALLQHLETLTDQTILIGTWSDAEWAIRFYQAHGYVLAERDRVPELLRTYWDISQRQVETSVVLAKPALAARLTPRATLSSPTTCFCWSARPHPA